MSGTNTKSFRTARKRRPEAGERDSFFTWELFAEIGTDLRNLIRGKADLQQAGFRLRLQIRFADVRHVKGGGQGLADIASRDNLILLGAGLDLVEVPETQGNTTGRSST